MKSAGNGAADTASIICPTQADKGICPSGRVAVERLNNDQSIPTVTDTPKPERFVSKRETMSRVGLGYTTIWKLMREGKFPRSRDLGRNKVAWVEREIDEFIRTRPVRRLKGD